MPPNRRLWGPSGCIRQASPYGCALIGIWLIIPAIASVIYNPSILYEAQRNQAMDTTNLRISWIYHVVEIGFGVWLLLGARGARKLFWWARGAGK